MRRSCTVLIAARDLLEPLRQRLDVGGDVLTFADSEPLRALETITERRPGLVALERLFAASPRGAALINRIKADPILAEAEIVILSHENNSSRTVHRRTTSPVKAPADQRGTRRAPRVRVRPGIEIMVDGNNAALIDLSTVGAQVLSPVWLRPNTRVRITLNEEDDSMRVNGVVAWARFEIPGGTGEPRYRCGIEFTDADTKPLERFCTRWQV
jgi:CheY-like chemotaxis protein